MKFHWWTIPSGLLLAALMGIVYLSPPIIGMPIVIICAVGVAIKICSLEEV